jgi:hypothetical protein
VITHSLKVIRDFERRHDLSQIARNRLLERK